MNLIRRVECPARLGLEGIDTAACRGRAVGLRECTISGQETPPLCNWTHCKRLWRYNCRVPMATFYESLRESLLGLGPYHPALRLAIRMQARLNGFKLSSTDS